MISSLTAENLTCMRGERMLFRDLSFRAEAGEVLAIEGPNGAGKTSLLRLVAGFIAPLAGKVRVGAVEDSEERGKLAGWLGHQDGLKSQLTAGEQLGFFARLYGVKPDIGAALERMGLLRQRDLPCRFLSAGQRKRLAIARLALLARPLWLLDEPFAALDSDGKRLAAGLVAAHAAAGGIALLATHEPLGARTLSLGAAP